MKKVNDKSEDVIKKPLKERIIVIMAGGTGTRLWPISRSSKPKQFHTLLSSKTLLQETYERALSIVPKNNIYISTTKRYQDLVFQNIPDISQDHLIIEPAQRSTAPGIALAALELSFLHKDAIIATIASDHAIGNIKEFSDALKTSFEAIEEFPDSIATLGINPTHPSTAFGYIKIGKEIENTFTKRVFHADAFKEKPQIATAKRYLSGWEYLWNAGYFVFIPGSLLELVKEYAPTIWKPLRKINKELQKPHPSKKTIETLYLTMPEDPIDTAIIEKMPKDKRLVIPTDLEWDDIGNWEALYDFLKNRYNSSIVAKGNHIDLGSKECFISGQNKLITTLNLKNIVIIDSEDAILVADRKTVGSDIKKLIDKLKKEGKCPYL
ncbi:MAG: mannose-1-phosphate guanylyltransferase [Candidatus Moraniibacteriota bacterium]|nr:MAG: mannose-1-phosphate guanylyltransferase [Candidatus Moranbacteria bacterium]